MRSFLENLSLADLEEISACADVLAEAGRAAEGRGFEPTFTMLPGQPIGLRLDVNFLPHHAAAPTVPTQEQIASAVQAGLSTADQVIETVLHADPEEAAPEVSLPVAVVEPEVAAAPEPIRWPSAPSAPPKTTSKQPPRWTPEEDEALVSMVALARHNGISNQRATTDVAAKLGKTPGACEIRSMTKLKDRILERMNSLAAVSQTKDKAVETATEEPGGEPGGLQQLNPAENAPVQEVVTADATTSEARPLPTSIPIEVWQHVEKVPRGHPFTLEVDRDLMAEICAGTNLLVIADQFEMKAKSIEGRFDILTKHRAFKREKVLEALEQMIRLAGRPGSEAAA